MLPDVVFAELRIAKIVSFGPPPTVTTHATAAQRPYTRPVTHTAYSHHMLASRSRYDPIS
jgi:hypothetical protein